MPQLNRGMILPQNREAIIANELRLWVDNARGDIFWGKLPGLICSVCHLEVAACVFSVFLCNR